MWGSNTLDCPYFSQKSAVQENKNNWVINALIGFVWAKSDNVVEGFIASSHELNSDDLEKANRILAVFSNHLKNYEELERESQVYSLRNTESIEKKGSFDIKDLEKQCFDTLCTDLVEGDLKFILTLYNSHNLTYQANCLIDRIIPLEIWFINW